MNDPNFIRPAMTGDMDATAETITESVVEAPDAAATQQRQPQASRSHVDPMTLEIDHAAQPSPAHASAHDAAVARLDAEKTPTEQQGAILSATKPAADQGTSEADPTIRTEADARNAHDGIPPR